jgi:hypothetical protein
MSPHSRSRTRSRTRSRSRSKSLSPHRRVHIVFQVDPKDIIHSGMTIKEEHGFARHTIICTYEKNFDARERSIVRLTEVKLDGIPIKNKNIKNYIDRFYVTISNGEIRTESATNKMGGNPKKPKNKTQKKR